MSRFVRGRSMTGRRATGSMVLTIFRFPLVLLCISILASLFPMAARGAAAAKLGVVQHIDGGLQLQPPHQRSRHGRVQDGLFSAYQLNTAQKQRASLSFVDGSVFHMNQRTDLILGSLNRAVLHRGELEALDRNRRHYIVRTNAAVVTATGTDFDVRIEEAQNAPSSPYPDPTPQAGQSKFPSGTTTVSVVTGTVHVSNRFGSTTVHANQWTHVVPGRAPTRPTTHQAAQDVAWASGLPRP